MKRTQICPKCQSSDIIKIQGNCGAYGIGNNIPTGKTIASAVLVNRYLCCSCGYSEEWINKGDIKRIVNSKICVPKNSMEFSDDKEKRPVSPLIIIIYFSLIIVAMCYFLFALTK